jgi:hypothetical protein
LGFTPSFIYRPSGSSFPLRSVNGMNDKIAHLTKVFFVFVFIIIFFFFIFHEKYHTIIDEISESLKLKEKLDDHDERKKIILNILKSENYRRSSKRNVHNNSKNEFHEKVFFFFFIRF